MSASAAPEDPSADTPKDAGSFSDEDVDTDADLAAEDEVPAQLPLSAPYVFDLSHVVAAAEVLDTAFAEMTDGPAGWGQVENAIEARGGMDEVLTRELAAVGGRSLSVGEMRKPGTEFVADRFLPDPKNASVDVVELWREVLGSVTHPAAVARLEELLMIRRDGNLVHRARHAAISYLAAVAGVDNSLTTGAYLTRAWTISRLFKLFDVEDVILDEIERRVRLPGARQCIGHVMPLLAVIAQKPTNSLRQGALHATAEKLLTDIVAMEVMHHVISEASDLRRKMITPGPHADAKRAETRIDEMAALRRIAAATSEPLVKQSHLATAARFATQHNLRSDLREIQRELEVVSAGDLGLEKISSSAHIPSWIPESELHAFTRGHTWHRGLRYFLESPVPCGDIDRIRTSVRGRPFAIRHLFTTVLLGADGLPRKTLTTPDEQVEHDVALHVAIASRHMGQIHGSGLYRLGEKYSTPTETELTTWLLDVYACDPDGARVLAKAFCHFWAGDYLEAAYVATPAVEAAARRLLREMDEGAYQVQVGNSPGKYPSLGTLLDELLRISLDPSWHYFLTWLLLGPEGSNIRNDIAHGFTTTMDPVHATLVLRSAALLITASGSVADEQKTLALATQLAAPRPGPKGLGDRAVAVMSRLLLRGHMLAEARRYRA
ncbi:hypothetical protein ASE27_15525 [Oerskovia sp. Root918]|uniref:hypothetical protein n=1 Tax=Oerskovia sp. Root918 TaxID=1736607 RepID=UPI0006F1C88F|nr:hypothetical protein [Oerskovia sp. Root918]KRD35207.1 hypothetical protein ASE27_15525 [Oerskovia sp. Root918]